jgi:hypothetical protein
VDPEIKLAASIQRPAQLGNDAPQSLLARQQRLPAVQHYLHLGQGVRRSVLGDPPRRLHYYVIRDDHGPTTPALVNGLVDVAVIAGKITARVDLEHHLAQRDNAGHGVPSSSDAGAKRPAMHRDGSLSRRRENTLHRYVHSKRRASRHLMQRYGTKISQLGRNVHCYSTGVLHSAQPF